MIETEPADIPEEALSNPALLYLYRRIEQILGIKASGESLIKLNDYLEKQNGASFIENPAAYESSFCSQEQIYTIARFFTVNETYFFREGVHFDILARHLLPQLTALNRPIRVCSAASSTGCEAYSIAMLLDFHAKNKIHSDAEFDFEIDAFDVNAEAIEAAKEGRYSANALRTDGANWKYIMDLYLDADGGEYTVSEKIRDKAHFFTHNIMRGLDKQYDVIFFRNALIYFTPQNRIIAMNALADSLADNGALFLGISETSSIRHPLLSGRRLEDAFFFQKNILSNQVSDRLYPVPPEPLRMNDLLADSIRYEPSRYIAPEPKPAKLSVDSGETAAILENDEGRQNAEKILEFFANAGGGIAASPSGSELAACIAFFLHSQNFDSADAALSYLEKRNNGAITLFLRGEYHLMRGNTTEAGRYFERSAEKERAFWPAFYRIAALAADGDPDHYKYKMRRACNSLERGKEQNYECFMGGFSPDYFLRILENKMA